MLQHLAAAPITTIAAISGSCMGPGMQLAVACDLRVVNSPARFAVPVAKLGLMVDKWTLDRVARLWGEGAARHMVLTAAVLTDDDARRLGFARERGDLDVAIDPARRAVPLAPLSQSGSKLGMGAIPAPDAVYSEAFARARASKDLVEGQRAFGERRTPSFEGR
ncbi:enoyl-CoA hydratase-related protein [Janibacter limosus]|uniref:Enoyl-CoA hydratase-related protein n=1 Tax=Janibacter limosus TaxID=53458 RepID=A0AC61U1R0_9MICO|nr:enoyl-CoA hydratase-related protein [Janibacter limosus]UUZ43803.1 enoyl-CoA hydratase-related protein [Janibacter limosus]